MGEWTPRILLLLVLGVILGLPFAWRPEEGRRPQAARRLVVITPHNEQIRYEVGEAFGKWHVERFGERVEIDWRRVGGSTDVLRLLTAQYEALAAKGEEERGAGYDVVFGGGDYLFDQQLKPGVTVRDR